MNAADAQFASMRAFAASLASNGVTDVCVSPGSRSTPLALAVAREEGLRVHVHLDERSSAFFALGLAKAKGKDLSFASIGNASSSHLGFELFKPIRQVRGAKGPQDVLDGLEEFREHLGGQLTIPMIKAPGVRLDAQASNSPAASCRRAPRRTVNPRPAWAGLGSVAPTTTFRSPAARMESVHAPVRPSVQQV